MRRKWLLGVIALMVVIVLVIPVSACQPVERIHRYTFGSASASSAHYAAAVVIANIINQQNADIKIAVVETGATHDNLMRAQDGKLDGGFGVTWGGMAMAYAGTTLDEYVAHGEWTELRLMSGYLFNYVFVVIVDEMEEENGENGNNDNNGNNGNNGDQGSDIQTLADLHERRFSAGITGSTTDFNLRRQFEALGIEPEWVSASQADVVRMAVDLEIVGFARATNKVALDSTMRDVQSQRKIKILGWPEEYLETALTASPGTAPVWIPEDAIEGLAPHDGFYALGHVTGIFVTTALPQDVVYRMAKAYVDGWDEYVRAWPMGADWIPLESDLDILAGIVELVDMPPLHAGIVQLMIERGYEVPPELIGPEYNDNDSGNGNGNDGGG